MNRHQPIQPKLAFTNENGELVILHSSGFFSCCTIRLRKIINYYNEYKKLPVVDSSNQWSSYKDEPGDISSKLFTTLDVDVPNSQTVEYSSADWEDQFSNYTNINYDDVGVFTRKYFTHSDEVNELAQALINKYNIDLDNTIAICYRGTDKRMETNIPTHDDMIEKIQSVHNQYPNHKLLIQTDEVGFTEYVKTKIPDFIQFTEVTKVASNKRATQFHIPIGGRLLHAQTFLAIMQILSRCDKVILNSGNVGMWVSLFRNNTDGVYQYLNIHGSNTLLKNHWIS